MSHKIDAMCFDGPIIPTTMKQQSFTSPIFYIPVYAYTRKDEHRFNSIPDLNKPDVTFTAIDGDLSQHLATYRFPNAKLQSYPGIVDSSQMLVNITTKKADIFLTDSLTAKNFTTTNPGQIKSLFPESPLAHYGITFSVSKDEPKLLELLNGGITAAHNMGLIEPILAKYDPDGTSLVRVAPSYQEGSKKTP